MTIGLLKEHLGLLRNPLIVNELQVVEAIPKDIGFNKIGGFLALLNANTGQKSELSPSVLAKRLQSVPDFQEDGFEMDLSALIEQLWDIALESVNAEDARPFLIELLDTQDHNLYD
ncbi:hypothetical protein BGZ65_005388 [Modicella reniformis]|uniref:Uncharacterized protein n=1 Tax=Modicella reniformis TaxID=1440133 RepID=A0A9P6MGU6_9FUNG|nr:hypothetical protein BGZ65_005388 [Modicella reniformis]